MAARVRAWFGSSRMDRELNEELESHLAMLVEEKTQLGMTPEEALRAARLELGGITQLRESHRETRGIPFLDTLGQDLRYTSRGLLRERSFTTFAILVAGLGIGGSATVFSVVDALLMRSLPFKDPSRLVWIANSGEDGDLSGQTVPVNPYVDLRSQNRSMSDIAAYYAFYGMGDKKLTGDGEPERLTAVPVSYNWLSVLGLEPQLGRMFTSQECQSYQPVVLLSAGLWRRRFASDPGIIGRKLTLNEGPVTVIGVMPDALDFGSIFAPGTRIDLFSALPLTPPVNRQGNNLLMVGRLKPGATVEQAQAEAAVLSEPIRVKNNRDELRFKVTLLDERVRGRMRLPLMVLAFAIGVVMLIVCANLSNLQLARAAAREKEFAIRAALGAGRGRLVRQMLTESLTLSCCAALLGLLAALAGTRLLARLDAVNLPLRESVQVNAAALAFTIGLALLTGVVFGLLPALRIRSTGVNHSLKDSSRGATEGRNHHWIRSSLVISEIAFACVLLVGAGLLVRSFLRLLDVDLGFHPERATALRIDPGARNTAGGKRTQFFNEVLRVVRSLPGIEAAGLADVLPLGRNRSWGAGAKGQTYSMDHPPPVVFVRIVSDGYLRAMGIPLRAGRDLSERDDASAKPVMLVNESLARLLWPAANPVGQTAIYVDRDREVVGVVGDVRHLALEKGSGYEMYLPIRQTSDFEAVDLIVRTSLSATALAEAIRPALLPLEPNLPRNEFQPLQQIVDRTVSPRRFVVLLLAGFSAFALALACLGIYGVISYVVTRRTQEIGIRMALGASASMLQARILQQTLGLASIGMLLGVAASWLVTGMLRGLLFEVTPTDPVTFAGALVVLLAVACMAGYFPARRASRIDPMVALRTD